MTITFKPTAKQYEALQYLFDDETTEIIFGGAAGGGKSFLGCAWLIISCLKYPGSRWLMGRSKLTTLKTTTLNTFFDVCKQFDLKADVDYSFNAASNIITFTNKSEILLKDLFFYPSDPQFDSLGSLEIAGCFCDEVSQLSSKAREVVKSRLGWKNSDGTEIKPKLYMSCNPSKNFSYTDFFLPWKEGTLPKDKKFIPALASSNKYLSSGRSESLDNLSGIERKRLLLGNWIYDSDPSALIDYDALVNMYTNDHIIDPNGSKRADNTIIKDKCISVDVARLGSDNTVILVWKGLHIIEYKVLSKHTTDQTAKIVKALQTQHMIASSQVIIDADGVGGGVVDQLKGSVSFNNGATPLHKENYSNLKSQCYFMLADVINKNEIYFPVEDDEIRERITKELEMVKRKDADKDGKLSVIPKDQVKKELGRSPDFSDAMMLRMWYIIKHKSQSFSDTYSFVIA